MITLGAKSKLIALDSSLVIASLRKAIAAEDIEPMRAMLQELLTDLQNTLED